MMHGVFWCVFPHGDWLEKKKSFVFNSNFKRLTEPEISFENKIDGAVFPLHWIVFAMQDGRFLDKIVLL